MTVVYVLVPLIALGVYCMVDGAARFKQAIQPADDVMKIADAVQVPRGPDDDPEFLHSLRGPQ